MKTLREVIFPIVVILGIAFAILASGCAKPDQLLKTGETPPSITHDQCAQLVKWRVLEGTIEEWQSSINSVSEVQVDGWTYRMTDECRDQFFNYQITAQPEVTRNR